VKDSDCSTDLEYQLHSSGTEESLQETL
jgi:hypothetical protein